MVVSSSTRSLLMKNKESEESFMNPIRDSFELEEVSDPKIKISNGGGNILPTQFLKKANKR
jgi:hypothetical protein